ncbi:unnamed protein product [Adineta ricciae]|uniref:EGF-like domain-containing protein n=1 Tax=Adineta ricciae TaxID=249248 RepID=A0A815NF43_ADIRI|nr:unnamed protein product [Adineta ricciae]CAF1435688.1 unnamed protein product [Adineta ricciae]
MVNRRILLLFIAVTLFISVLQAERARNDNLQDAEEEMDFTNDSEDDDVIETIKRFWKNKKTTTPKPSSDSISALITTTKPTSISKLSTSTKSSVFGGLFGDKGKTTSGSRLASSTSRSGTGRLTTAAPKDACGAVNPCNNGGTCKTLSSGSYYCFCGQDHYGKRCENKFMFTGAANADRARKDHCADQPCRNGGECVGLRTTYYCRCKSPYYGIKCDKRLSKREEVADESVLSDEQMNIYERELQDDNEDLRRVIANENFE